MLYWTWKNCKLNEKLDFLKMKYLNMKIVSHRFVKGEQFKKSWMGEGGGVTSHSENIFFWEYCDMYFTFAQWTGNVLQTARKYVTSDFSFWIFFSKTICRRCRLLWTTFNYSQRGFSLCPVCTVLTKHPVQTFNFETSVLFLNNISFFCQIFTSLQIFFGESKWKNLVWRYMTFVILWIFKDMLSPGYDTSRESVW